MPVDYKKYPPNWKTEIRPRILERAGHKCEQCGVANYAVGYWGSNERFYTMLEIEMSDGSDDEMYNALNHIDLVDKKPVKVILTISHIDHNLDNNDDTNLRALCQLHHLRHDREQHKQNARKTIERKKGLQNLF